MCLITLLNPKESKQPARLICIFCLETRVQEKLPRLMFPHSSVQFAAQPNFLLEVARACSTHQLPIRKQSSSPLHTIFRAISWHCKHVSGLNATQTKRKKMEKRQEKLVWFGSRAESKQQKLNVALLIDAFLCQTSLFLQKQWGLDVALKNAFCLPTLKRKMCLTV